MTAATAFKILTHQQWADFERERVFHGAPVDIADGYIHLSTAEQLEGTIAKHFTGQTDLMIAEVDLICLGDAIRWEEARGGELFPHLYAELPITAVIGLQKRD
jgi:beta-hydroxylase